MRTLTLTDHEIEMIASALDAISPVGGGSSPHSLMMKVIEQTTIGSNEAMVTNFLENVKETLIEAGVVQ